MFFLTRKFPNFCKLYSKSSNLTVYVSDHCWSKRVGRRIEAGTRADAVNLINVHGPKHKRTLYAERIPANGFQIVMVIIILNIYQALMGNGILSPNSGNNAQLDMVKCAITRNVNWKMKDSAIACVTTESSSRFDGRKNELPSIFTQAWSL